MLKPPADVGGNTSKKVGNKASAAAANNTSGPKISLTSAGISSKSLAADSKTKTSLLARLHQLLSSLHEATDAVKNWPSSQDAQVHYDATTTLIKLLQKVVDALKEVEERTCGTGDTNINTVMGQSILDSPVVLDLLDLMDYGNGLNPEIFIKQLIREALRQLSRLKRRKLALSMLGQAIEKGLKDMDMKEEMDRELLDVMRSHSGTRKRPRDENDDDNMEKIEPPEKKKTL